MGNVPVSGWQAFLDDSRASAREIEILTARIANGGRDWSAGGASSRGAPRASPTEAAAMMGLTLVPQLPERRERHERRVGRALRAIQSVRERLGRTEGDVLEMFYIDGMLTWEIAGELGLTVDGVFYRKRRAIEWMDANLPMEW